MNYPYLFINKLNPQKMKTVFFSIVLTCMALTASGQTEVLRFPGIGEFSGIDASSVFDITLTKGDKESLTVEVDEEMAKHVVCVVKNGVLHLSLKPEIPTKKVNLLKADIVMRELNSVDLSGACKLESPDLFTPSSFRMECSGASKSTLKLRTGRLNVEVNGAGSVNLNAEVKNEAKIDMSGASKMNLTLQAESVNWDMNGSASIDVSGKAESASIDISGAAKISGANFVSNSVSIDCSGACHVALHVIDKLKIDASGASVIRYRGNPSIDMDSSGATKVRRMD
jgi:hypothetical protein